MYTCADVASRICSLIPVLILLTFRLPAQTNRDSVTFRTTVARFLRLLPSVLCAAI